MPPTVVLNVAEKPSVAKEIAAVLGGGSAQRSSGPEKRCPIWTFDCAMPGYGTVTMRVTSVMGHLRNLDFVSRYRFVAWLPTTRGD